MLKFLREYNKYILSVGIIVLMIAFLIQPALQMFTPGPGNEVLGTVGEEEVTLKQRAMADRELAILGAIWPPLTPWGFGEGAKDNSLRWLLFIREAQDMGLSASDAEVNDLLPTLEEVLKKLGLEGVRLAERAARLGEDPRVVHEALRHWLMYQTYWTLMHGHRHLSWVERVAQVLGAYNLAQIGHMGQAQELWQKAEGSVRVSEPLRVRFLNDQLSQVRITALSVDADRYTQRVGEIEDAALIDHFERYKDDLPGQGKPYGFGYRFPDRVKLEYLAIPLERVKRAVRVEESEALQYYDTHLDEFRVETPPAPEVSDADAGKSDGEMSSQKRGSSTRPYAAVRGRIMDQLKNKRAMELCEKMMKSARAILRENVQKWPEEGGYVVVPEDWTGVALEEAAGRLQAEFGVLPDVQRLADRWLTGPDLAQLPGIGKSRTEDQRGWPFAVYALSAKELRQSEQGNPLAAYRLQARLPSVPLIDGDRTRYMFRLVEAQPSRSPQSIEEVGQQVRNDVQRLKAYELLQAEAAMWQQRVADGTLEAVAATLSEPLVRTSFARRQPRRGPSGLVFEAPFVEGVGQDPRFVDEVFELADTVTQLGGVSAVPVDRRVVVVPVDGKQRLVLARLEEIMAVPQPLVEMMKKDPASVDTWVGQALQTVSAGGAVSLEAMEQRLGFKPVER